MQHRGVRRRWRMPAEWEAHRASWIAWPQRAGDWPGKFAPIPWVFADIVRHLQRAELVHILVDHQAAEGKARTILVSAGVDLEQIRFFRIATNRVWTRDYGPIFVVDCHKHLAVTDWQFNAWAKYADFQHDARVAQRIRARLKLPGIRPQHRNRWAVLEGGSIEVNGAGILLTTEECLLSSEQARNPCWVREDYQQLFAEHLGIGKVLWLGKGIAGDDTHGHIDDLARFTSPRTIVAVVEDNAADVNYKPLQDNLDRLRGMTDLEGRRFEVVPLPMPEPLYFRGQRLPASYANFYIANDRVLVPTFNDPHDRLALGILAEQFPNRQVIGMHALDLVWGLGTLHCLTQQEPAVAL